MHIAKNYADLKLPHLIAHSGAGRLMYRSAESDGGWGQGSELRWFRNKKNSLYIITLKIENAQLSFV